MKSGIYKITCKETGKIYIGLSKRMKSRFQKHLSDLKNGIHGNPYMKNIYNKYGKEAFEFSIVEYCDPEILYERENFWINHLNSSNPNIGFNIIVDPKREKEKLEKCNSILYKEKMRFISNKRWEDPDYANKNIKSIQKAHQERKEKGIPLAIHSEESKKKSYESCHTNEFLQGLSKRTLKQLENPEYRDLALKNLEKGRNNPIRLENIKKSNQSPEYRKMMSEKQKISHKKRKLEKRNKKREESNCFENISNGLKRYFSTKEGKKQIHETAKNRWHNLETREKYIQGMKERRKDPEYRKMMSEKTKASWDKRRKNNPINDEVIKCLS